VTGEILNNQRAGDQLGTLLAGCYSLINDQQVSEEECKTFIMSFDLSEPAQSKDTKDEVLCLQEILGHQLKITSLTNKIYEVTLGELIEISVYQKLEEAISFDDAIAILRRTGVVIDYKHDRVIFAYSSKVIKKILADTPWKDSYGMMLKRLPSAIYERQQMDFTPGIRDKYVSLSADFIFKGIEDDVV
jgi:putative DNA primase/helicase